VIVVQIVDGVIVPELLASHNLDVSNAKVKSIRSSRKFLQSMLINLVGITLGHVHHIIYDSIPIQGVLKFLSLD